MKKGKRGIGKKNRAIPIAPVVPVIGAVWGAYNYAGKHLNYTMLNNMTAQFTGYDMQNANFNFERMKPFVAAEAIGLGVHFAAGMKIRGKTLNSYIRRLTFGMLEL